MLDAILLNLPAILGSSVITLIVKTLIDHFSKGRKVDQFQLLGEIDRLGDKYISSGSIPKDQLKRFCETYDLYHDLGGDGYADAIYKKVTALPIEKEDK